jgi:hypothetical protein
MVPPGGALAKKVSTLEGTHTVSGTVNRVYAFRAPAEDFALELAAHREVEAPPGAIVRDPAPPPQVTIRAQGDPRPSVVLLPPPPARTVADPARSVLLLAAPDRSRGPSLFVARKGVTYPDVQFYPRPVREDHLGCWALELEIGAARHGRAMVRRDGRPIERGDAWWSGTSWGRELIPWSSPRLGNYYGWGPAKLLDLGTPRPVLIEDPHPFVASEYLPRSLGPKVALALAGGRPRTFRPVMSRYVMIADHARNELREVEGALIGWYTEAESGNLFARLDRMGGIVGEGYRFVARDAALRGLIIAAVTIATGGIGGVAVTQAVSAASAPAGGLVFAPGGGSPLGDLVQAVAQHPADTAATNEREVNSLLEEVAKGTSYLAGIDGFYGTLFRELAIMAQDPRDRDALRLALIRIRGELAAWGGKPLAIGRAVFEAVRSAVIAIGTAGIGTAAELALKAGERAAEEMQKLLEARNLIEVRRIMEERVRARHLEQLELLIARWNEESRAAEEAAAPAAVAGEGTAAGAPVVAERAGPTLWERLLEWLAALWRELTGKLATG